MPDDVQPDVESAEQTGATGEPNSNQQPEASAKADADSPAQTSAEVESGQPAEKAPRKQRSARTTRSPRGQRSSSVAVAEEPEVEEDAPPPRLLDTYRKEIVPALMGEFGFDNPMRVPRIKKIVLNIGVGEALTDNKAMEGATRDLMNISGQKPVITRARKSIAGFKVREGNPIGTSVTLRGARMYHFLDRLINVALPRIRDFRGIPRQGFDGRGNFSIGIREQIIFPEIDYNQIDRIRGFQVTIATNAPDDAEAIRLLELYGMPFVRQT